MSYLATYRRQLTAPQATGGILDTIGSAATAASKVIEDPALPEVTSLVLRLNATNKSTGGRPPAKGIGLSAAVTPLKGFLYYRQHPWLVPAGVLAILGVVFYSGTRYGKKRSA